MEEDPGGGGTGIHLERADRVRIGIRKGIEVGYVIRVRLDRARYVAPPNSAPP
jgi:hypothetical protein